MIVRWMGYGVERQFGSLVCKIDESGEVNNDQVEIDV